MKSCSSSVEVEKKDGGCQKVDAIDGGSTTKKKGNATRKLK